MMMIERSVVERAMEALVGTAWGKHPDRKEARESIDDLRAALKQQDEPVWMHPWPPVRAQQAEPKVEGGPPPPLAVPPEVAATLTTTDIAWLQTHRLTKIWQELGQMRWVGADHGWDLAIKAVRRRLNDECQDVLDWKAQADQSGATAVELLQKVQGLRA